MTILNAVFYVWCALCIFTEGAAALAVWKKEGIFPGLITTLMLATPWLLII